MKISEGLLLLTAISEEMGRLKELAKSSAWEYRSTDPNAKWFPTFDLEANHKKVVGLSKLHRKLSRAISLANSTVNLDIDDKLYEEWL